MQLADTTTSTTEVPQIVGTYPGQLPVLGSAAGLFVVIVAAGGYMTWRTRRAKRVAELEETGSKKGGG
ncbi:MAG TPA: hypothetical protein VGH94_11630 [Acidimicrobiales bacterium]